MSAAVKLSGPSRPMNMVSVMMRRPAAESSGVIPVVSPTCQAEKVSREG